MIIKDSDDLVKMWSEDSEIDQFDLNSSNSKTGKLHSKYSGIMTTHAKIAKGIEAEFKRKKRVKFEYYCGEIVSREELEKHGLQPLRKKILKVDIQFYLETDDDLIKIQLKKFFHDEIVEFCKFVLKELNNRTWQIKSMIDWNKFQSGG